jgi:hypothetical protein
MDDTPICWVPTSSDATSMVPQTLYQIKYDLLNLVWYVCTRHCNHHHAYGQAGPQSQKRFYTHNKF